MRTIKTTLADQCIYTIVHSERLAEAAREGGPAPFEESRAWITGRKLWQKAETEGKAFPVLLGDATKCIAIE